MQREVGWSVRVFGAVAAPGAVKLGMVGKVTQVRTLAPTSPVTRAV